jgi:hypothetical protein
MASSASNGLCNTMSDADHFTSPEPRLSVPDRLDDYRRRREALDTQARELVELHRDLLDAVARDAAVFVADARAKVARALADARADLLRLKRRLEIIAQGQPGRAGVWTPPLADAAAQHESVQLARREIKRLLDDVSPEIERLEQEARTLGAPVPVFEGSAIVAAEALSEERDHSRPEEAGHDDAGRHEPETSPPLPATRAEPEDPAGVPRSSLRRDPPDIQTLLIPPSPLPERDRSAPQITQFGPVPSPHRRLLLLWIITLSVFGIAIVVAVTWFRSGPTTYAGGEKSASPGAVAPQASRDRESASPNPERGSVAASSSAPAAVAPAAGRLTVDVETRRSVWMLKIIDGVAGQGRIVAAGERNKISADRNVSIRAGDAGAVLVSVNGGMPQPLGRDGEVITRRFTAGPSQTPDQMPSRVAVTAPTPAGSAARSGAGAIPEGAAPSQMPSRVPSGADHRPPMPQSPPDQSPPGHATPPTSDLSPAPGELTNAAQRWLDAYDRQDTATMQAVAMRGMKVSDLRTAAERLPPAAVNARRALEGISFQFVGDTAIMTARMTQTGTVDSRAEQRVSWISLMWMRDGGQWRLMDVQLLSDAKLRAR